MATADQGNLLWYDLRALAVEGAAWPDAAAEFRRLPDLAQGLVREPVWDLSQHSSGLRVRFITDAHEISLRWTLRDARIALDHMPASGVSGFDLYARDGGTWRWAGLARPAETGDTSTRILKNIPAEPHEYLLYFPLYNGVTSVAIGVNADAAMHAVPAQSGRPLVFYGTSITQGASASRPGMTYPAQLARRLDVPFINLGFAGNGTMDLDMAELLAEIDASAYVIDCLPNMDKDGVALRARPFLEALRHVRPDTPIILVESIVPRNAWFLPWQQQAAADNTKSLHDIVDRLDAHTRRHVFWVSNEFLSGPTSDSAVDGLHPTDLGFVYMADALEPVLLKALRRNSR
jgi:lysophospholipase L1-like esterase